ncbi:hypothetical protein CspeluHIS016_0211160 [Cutaneotrichosporon spelunceum]|uniref:Uncharacterized protein n=1 Tax=Cutaneotrichosporon spelunceum TaxID=1672016 RepID=A0AAD3YAJ0_9TREE|nr:hypothetical protein CspeluHIS016_0211160 [Cutaneotrichosporon spelunceum]
MSMSNIFRKKSRSSLFDRDRDRSSGPAPPSVPALPSQFAMGGDNDTRAPDTRMLSSLGGCAGTVSTVVEDALLPMSPTALEFGRRKSTASAMSCASSTIIATPTYPSDPMWPQRKQSGSDSSHKQFEVIEGVESEGEDETDYTAIRVEAPTPERDDSDSITSEHSSVSALVTTYQSDLFPSRSDEYDMSKLLAALGEDINGDEQAVASPFGFETIGRGRDAKFFKDREVVVDTEDFYEGAHPQRRRVRCVPSPSHVKRRAECSSA